MGWFSRHRRPFSRAFFDRLDRIESAVTAMLGEPVQEVTAPEVIPAEIISSRTVGGVEEFAWREVTTEPNDTGGRASDGHDAAGAADPYAFPAKNPAEGQTFVIKHWVSATEGGNPIHDVRYTVVGGAVASGLFEARVTSPTQVSGSARWRYSWTEVVYDPATGLYVTLDGGRSSGSGFPIAINTLEADNTGTSAYGIAVASGASGAFYVHDTADRYQFKPVPTTVVMMRLSTAADGSMVASFSAPNPIDGNC